MKDPSKVDNPLQIRYIGIKYEPFIFVKII